MILNYKKANVITFPTEGYKKDGKDGSSPKNALAAGLIQLKPGTNKLTPEQVADLKKNADFLRHVKDGTIEFVGDKGFVDEADKDAPADLKDIKNLEAYKVKDAIELIEATMEIEHVQRWLDAEKAGKKRELVLKEGGAHLARLIEIKNAAAGNTAQ